MESEESKELAADGNSDPLRSFEVKSGILRDRVSMVANREATGLYLDGPPGTGKTHTVKTKLDELGVTFEYCNGHVTPRALFNLIERHQNEVIVLDDISSMFNTPQSLNILLAATGGQPCGSRLVRWDHASDSREVYFSGGIVMLSNLKLRNTPVHEALKSRVETVAFDPTPAEIEAFLRHHLEQGCAKLGLSGQECTQVLEYILEQCDLYESRLDFRLVLDKGLKDFRFWKDEQSESDWRDLIASSIKERADTIQHSLGNLGRADRTAAEVAIAGQIHAEFPDRASRVQAWMARTRKSERSFYRHLKGLA